MIRRKLPKKELEKIYFDDFISHKPIDSIIIDIEESETPDFIIHEKNKTISVEVTRLIHPALAEREAFREKIVSKVHELFKAKYNSELYVLIAFSKAQINCKNTEVERFAQNILSIIEKIYLANRKYRFDICADDLEDINEHIESISVSNNRMLENWQSFGAFKVNAIDNNWLRKIIADKEALIENYDRNTDENWLLLVSNFGFKSDTHDFYTSRMEKFESKFNKVFIYTYREKEIINLK